MSTLKNYHFFGFILLMVYVYGVAKSKNFSSSLLQSPKTQEKICDISRLKSVPELDKTQYVNESIVRSHHKIDDDFEDTNIDLNTVDPHFPDDIINEFDAEHLVIDCNTLKKSITNYKKYNFLNFL